MPANCAKVVRMKDIGGVWTPSDAVPPEYKSIMENTGSPFISFCFGLREEGRKGGSERG